MKNTYGCEEHELASLHHSFGCCPLARGSTMLERELLCSGQHFQESQRLRAQQPEMS